MEMIRLRGNAARPYVNELAALRLKVFYEFPYLYEGTLEYEKKYLETYFKAQNSFVLKAHLVHHYEIEVEMLRELKKKNDETKPYFKEDLILP